MSPPALSQFARVPWTSSSATTPCASPWPGSATGRTIVGTTRTRIPRSAVSDPAVPLPRALPCTGGQSRGSGTAAGTGRSGGISGSSSRGWPVGPRGWRWLRLRERSRRGAERGEGLAVGRGLVGGGRGWVRRGLTAAGRLSLLQSLCFSLRSPLARVGQPSPESGQRPSSSS